MSSTAQRVVVGMSGGVDSSVAAHLLKQQGYDVIGVTMKVWPQDCISRAEDKCCGPSAIADARGVAHALGIPHYVVEESTDFQRQVIDYFAAEYQAGRTPNPCVLCNEKLKFGNLWHKARALGAAYIATGHYAIIEHHQGRAILRKGRDPRKDQSYFLFSLRQEQLLHSLMPLGAMSKPEIRDIARSIGLKVAEKEDSQEICFVPGQDYKAFLRGHLGEKQFHAGGIYDKQGNFLAAHEGIEMFTIGQRKGLPGGSPRPRTSSTSIPPPPASSSAMARTSSSSPSRSIAPPGTPSPPARSSLQSKSATAIPEPPPPSLRSMAGAPESACTPRNAPSPPARPPSSTMPTA
jgi:tRNA-specific 2-thiouridylase